MRTYMVGTPEGRAVAERTAGPTRADGEAVARVALAAIPRPTAILALSDLLARGVLDVAQWMGIAVPRDLSVAGIDDLEGSDAMRLTTCFVPYRPLGELAGATLTALVEGAEPPPPPVLPTVLTIRGTTGPPGVSAPPRP
jgi:DNA-binding LacI/PurR family transcriptional regulator